MALIVAFRNISDLADISDYEYGVYINDRLIEQGLVTGHPRAEGWPALLKRLAQQKLVDDPAPTS